MNFNYDHDRFVLKNKMLADGYSVDKKDTEIEKKGFLRHLRLDNPSCFNCKLKNKCAEFRTKQSAGMGGVASISGNEKFWCDRYCAEPSREKLMTDKQIKSLLKNTKKGR